MDEDKREPLSQGEMDNPEQYATENESLQTVDPIPIEKGGHDTKDNSSSEKI
ncbi:hypothetical protein BpJC7_22650 [Weizmannia acidilactici]|uniref:Uncharacterized protein n=1 Tax=Weizmannia acidilactici TaxID=2607726 RepID=A0A5J4J7T7_9BACI|nr:hypothetical protein [Weizmannia acidilactici]GER68577.1 hypothetical protein BpJC4_30480 [Weizmannia acidilactici]GER70962.1 hypothetical protein BpJC7_22650 [Weizmannia acidilactici]GER75161.1 hypothetical protein BpPP18_32280 [Weizmannia acidilactici]